MGMVDIGQKPKVLRVARARGEILLKKETIEEIKRGTIKKGDPIRSAEIAGILAAKQIYSIIPYCHQIPLDSVDFEFQVEPDRVIALCTVRAHWNTGVEMEALLAVSVALNTIWDMVKYLEKDAQGQYPHTRIREIVVLEKKKEEA
jgi:cyclic pyranopterin phosphate synthase